MTVNKGCCLPFSPFCMINSARMLMQFVACGTELYACYINRLSAYHGPGQLSYSLIFYSLCRSCLISFYRNLKGVGGEAPPLGLLYLLLRTWKVVPRKRWVHPYYWNAICGAYTSYTAAPSKEWNVFALSNPGNVGSNPAQDMDVCALILCLCCSVCRQRPCDGLIPRPRSPTNCLYD
jgi:hypothetical protein